MVRVTPELIEVVIPAPAFQLAHDQEQLPESISDLVRLPPLIVRLGVVSAPVPVRLPLVKVRLASEDRKSVVEGKSVVPGGRRVMVSELVSASEKVLPRIFSAERAETNNVAPMALCSAHC